MTILCVIDGPKGSGKTTLASTIAERLNAEHVTFNADRRCTQELIRSCAASDTPYVFERGCLSELIYRWLWNSQNLTGQGVLDQPTRDRADFELLLDSTQAFVILTSSESDLLIERINGRFIESGKGMEDFERNELELSRVLFDAWGQILSAINPEKVHTLLIDSRPTIDEEIDSIMKYING